MKRTRIKSCSDKRAKRLAEYSKVRKVFLASNPACSAKLKGCRGKSSEVHHKRGRIGRLLCDTRFFVAICRRCHDWIGDNGAEARKLGLLSPAQEFNVPPDDLGVIPQSVSQ